jgi:hypothetical protein
MTERKIDFTVVVDYIFKNKNKYLELSDADKEIAFFMINRKFSAYYPSDAKKLNYKIVNRASAIDIWFKAFKKTNDIPFWYWTKVEKKESKKISKSDIDIFLKYNKDINPRYLDFIINFYEEDMKTEIKKLKKYEI